MVFEYDIPFVPSSDGRLELMMKLARIKPGEKACDLGAGEGKLVKAMAMRGAFVDGFEIDEVRAEKASDILEEEGLSDRAKVHLKNLWTVDVSAYDVITIYGITSIMERLERKLLKEGKEGARVVSNGFTMPNWEPYESEGNVYLYLVTKTKAITKPDPNRMSMVNANGEANLGALRNFWKSHRSG